MVIRLKFAETAIKVHCRTVFPKAEHESPKNHRVTRVRACILRNFGGRNGTHQTSTGNHDGSAHPLEHLVERVEKGWKLVAIGVGTRSSRRPRAAGDRGGAARDPL